MLLLLLLELDVVATRGRWGHHDFGDKVDDGRGRLFSLQLGEDVALVVRFAGRFPGYETEAATEIQFKWNQIQLIQFNAVSFVSAICKDPMED